MREPCSNVRVGLNLLCILEVILGIIIIIVTASYQHVLSTFMVPMDQKLLSAKLFNVYLLGFQLIAAYLCSLTLWRRIWCRRYSPTTEILLSIWLFFCSLIIISGLASIWSLLNSSEALINNTEVMLFYGIDLYYMMPEWKLLWDQLQYTQQCCGVRTYEDWSHANWLPPSNTQSENDNYDNIAKPGKMSYIKNKVKRSIKTYADVEKYIREYEASSTVSFEGEETTCVPENVTPATTMVSITTTCPIEETTCQTNKPVHVPIFTTAMPTTLTSPTCDMGVKQTLAPYACCKHNSTTCYKNYLPRPENSPVPHLSITDINNEGCITMFSDYINSMLNTLLVLILLAILIDIIVCCLTKFIMFYHRNDQDNEDLQCCDDDGNALVIVQCPPKVKCITLEEQRRQYGSYDNVAEVDHNGYYCDEAEDNHNQTILH